ncbi:efflux transporter outer membrane subunit [Caballeronia sp. dw_276]|uniref:efflux transporter outer membrane subunit n=1 Tax=Caballeronia sp. dw_276 TaxID=2719795 RepID=UPI001BD46D46|nr:efflux transporter outer membrane subunit [Caballeronia sp. dw_276]
MNDAMFTVMRSRCALFSAAIASAVLLGGCAFIRNDTAPVVQVAEDRVKVSAKLDLPAADWPSEQWWLRYDDAQLSALIDQGLAASPTMALARQRVAQARAQAELTVASAGPQLSASGTIDRERVSSNGFLSAYTGTDPSIGANGPWYTTGLVGFDGAWDLDIWGRHRAQIAAAVGVDNAKKAEEAETALELSTDIARTYYAVQTAYAEIDLLKQQKDALLIQADAHRSRFTSGLEPDTAAKQAEANLLTVDQQIAQASEQVTNGRESIRALIGADSRGLGNMTPQPLPAVTTGVPDSLGFQLLARRPDLQALHWYVVSSLKQVDAAKAAFYPDFDIKAFFGFNALDVSQLFLHASQQINIGPGLYLPVFDSGRLNASLRGERASSNATILQYNQAVLNAVRDVAQNGSALKDLNVRTAMQQRKIQDVQFILNSAAARYGRGLIDRVQVEQAQEMAIQEQLAMLKLTGQSLQTSIALTKTLGGGYQSDVGAR